MSDRDDTQPLSILNQIKRVFEPLSINELSDSEVFEVRKLITAFVEADRIINRKDRGKPPEPYYERFYIWQMLFQLAAQATVAIGIIGLMTTFVMWDAIPTNVTTWSVLIGIIGLVVVGLYCFRIYVLWSTTSIYSNTQETGIRRPRNRWLLITELSLALKTASIQTKDASKGQFASFFNFNCWRITFDSPSDEDKFFRDLRYVKDGDRLKATVSANQQFNE